MKIDMYYVGEKIKQRRIQLGLSQEDLAKKLGYKSRSTINKIELGINSLHQTKFESFAKALEIEPIELLKLDKNKDWIELKPVYFNKQKTHYLRYFRSNNKKKVELKFILYKNGKENTTFINEDDFEEIVLYKFSAEEKLNYSPIIKKMAKDNMGGLISMVHLFFVISQMNIKNEGKVKEFIDVNESEKFIKEDKD